jgi:hypothetical protein
MAQPGILSSQIPPGEDHVMRALADIKREMRELGPSIMHSFQGVVDELAAHQATLDAQQATLTTTVAGLSTAVADIATNLASINDLLTKVVTPASVNVASGVTFTASGAYYDGVQTNITVPAGVSRLQIQAFSGIFCWSNSNTTGGNNGAGGDDIYCRTIIGGVTGQGFVTVILGSGSTTSVYSSLATLLSGLTPGSTISLATQTMSSYQNIPANVNNKAILTAQLTWLI